MENNLLLLFKLILSNSSIARLEKLANEEDLPLVEKPKLVKVEPRDGRNRYTLFYQGPGLLVDVNVTETTPSISPEALAAAGGMMPVDFHNFRARPWRTDKGEVRMSVKADKIIPATTDKK